MKTERFKFLTAVILLTSACGRGVSPSPPATALTDTSADMSTAGYQLAFLQAMVPHHELAIQMANMAGSKATTAQARILATEIIKAQSAEIEEMNRIHHRIFGAALRADMMAHDKLGLSMQEAGMDMDMKMLENAPDFDRMFLAHMTSHHEGAIRMAKAVLDGPDLDPEVIALARHIITAQQKEIEMMRAGL